MPHLDELYKQYQKDVVVIGISDEDDAKVKAFIKQAKHSYPQAIDPEATVKNALEIQGIPHVVVLSTDGIIRWQGNPHPSADLPGLQDTIAKLIEIDPGIKARARAREEGQLSQPRPQSSAVSPSFTSSSTSRRFPTTRATSKRTCIATGCALHLVRPLGFDTSEKACRRAGLDYWPRLNPAEHQSFEARISPRPGRARRILHHAARGCSPPRRAAPSGRPICAREIT